MMSPPFRRSEPYQKRPTDRGQIRVKLSGQIVVDIPEGVLYASGDHQFSEMHPPRASVRRGSVNTTFALIFLSGLFVAHTLCALPQKLGDLDGDGQPTVLDLVILLNHINATPRLSNEMAVFADLNQDGVVNNLDVDMLVDAILWIRPLPDFPLTRILESSPANGDSGVGVMRETIIYFTQPLSASTLITPQNLYAQFCGQKLVTRIELSPDRRKVTLFYVYPLPGSARVRVTFDGARSSAGVFLPLCWPHQPTAAPICRSTSRWPMSRFRQMGWSRTCGP